MAWQGATRLMRLTGGVLDLVLPPRPLDPGLGGSVQTHGLSAKAWSRIAFIDPPACDGCGLPLGRMIDGIMRCAACLARPPAFDRARAACVYEDPVRDLILAFKHGDRTDLAGLFALWLQRAAADLLPQADAIAPVPLHPLRLLARRYNQAAEVARPLARLAGKPYFASPVVRRRRTLSQGGRSASGRRRNVAGAFEVPASWTRRVAGRRILLVDDVLTTGATLEACARALKAAGAAGVDVAVIARVRLAGMGLA